LEKGLTSPLKKKNGKWWGSNGNRRIQCQKKHAWGPGGRGELGENSESGRNNGLKKSLMGQIVVSTDPQKREAPQINSQPPQRRRRLRSLGGGSEGKSFFFWTGTPPAETITGEKQCKKENRLGLRRGGEDCVENLRKNRIKQVVWKKRIGRAYTQRKHGKQSMGFLKNSK